MVLAGLAMVTVPAARAQDRWGSAEVDADWHTLATPPRAPGQFELLTRSSLPDMVTGGDALIAVRGLDPAATLTVTRNGTDVSDRFRPVTPSAGPGDPDEPPERHGLVDGLVEGDNHLVASDGTTEARLVVRNHPTWGPVISGPHQQPFRCETLEAGLGPALDEHCSAPTEHRWFYRSVLDQGFHELADPHGPYPNDVLVTTTSDGRVVPFVVRIESATINRSITRIAVLDDPANRSPAAPFTPQAWNGRVYHAFGESCGVGYRQGHSDITTVLGSLDLTTFSPDSLLINLTGLSDRLSKGDAVVHSTLTSFGVHCSPMVSIETMSMIKEHLIERYGPVRAVVGTNGSGAALQQYNAANNAPGLLSAALPTATFADVVTTAMTVTDCGLLRHYYRGSSLDWTPLKRAAVDGHNLLTTLEVNDICQSWEDTFLDRLDPTARCVPDEVRYHPETNPRGVRCSIQDANVNVFGVDPATGFARRPLDNVGVQYGLAALQAGTISAAEFLDLNRNIGGYDIDGQPQPQRHEMDDEVAEISYRIGGVVGRGALAETPVMDIAPYLDLIPSANIHEAVRPFVIRDRLAARTGHTESQSIWRGVLTQADAYPVLEQWLTALEAAPTAHGTDRAAVVRATKPAAAHDRCSFGTIGGRLELPDALRLPLGLAQLPLLPGIDLDDLHLPLRVDLPEDFASGRGPCALVLPVTATPRMAAGGPRADDIIKCQLQPVDDFPYPASIGPAERAQLAEVFPDGVCDFTRPAAADVERSVLWPSLGTTAGQEPVGLRWRVARSLPPTHFATAGRAPEGSAATADPTSAGTTPGSGGPTEAGGAGDTSGAVRVESAAGRARPAASDGGQLARTGRTGPWPTVAVAGFGAWMLARLGGAGARDRPGARRP